MTCDQSDLRDKAIAEQIRDESGEYYYLEPGNLLEALVEARVSNMERVINPFAENKQQALADLLKRFQYEDFGKLAEQISLEYWTDHLEGEM